MLLRMRIATQLAIFLETHQKDATGDAFRASCRPLVTDLSDEIFDLGGLGGVWDGASYAL